MQQVKHLAHPLMATGVICVAWGIAKALHGQLFSVTTEATPLITLGVGGAGIILGLILRKVK